jgi:hypothetical protein
LLDPDDEGRIYVGLEWYGDAFPSAENYSNGGLFLTEDDGKTWKKLFDGPVNSLTSDNSKPRNIYMGTGYGITKFLDTLTATSLNDNYNNLPLNYSLSQNYPNPFNATTVIKYTMPTAGFVTLKIYDMLGKEISTVINSHKYAGEHSITYTASDLASGVYLYRLQINDFISSKKFILLK